MSTATMAKRVTRARSKISRSRKASPRMNLNFEEVLILEGENGVNILNQLLSEPPFRTVVCEIHPDVAQVILDKYYGENRKVAKRYKRSVVDSIKNSAWQITGDTIKFTTKNELKDGQHRLLACIEAKKPIITHVYFGASPDSFKVTDIGKSRTPANMLQIAGYKYPNERAAATRLTWIYNNKGIDDMSWSPPKSLENHEKLKKHFDPFFESMEGVQSYYHDVKAQGEIFPSVALAVYGIIHKINPSIANTFMEAWLYDGRAGRNEVFRRLTQKIKAIKEHEGAKLPAEFAFAWLIITFNHWVKNKPVTKSDLAKPSDGFPVADLSGYIPYN